jgi:hypothetical protein
VPNLLPRKGGGLVGIEEYMIYATTVAAIIVRNAVRKSNTFVGKASA